MRTAQRRFCRRWGMIQMMSFGLLWKLGRKSRTEVDKYSNHNSESRAPPNLSATMRNVPWPRYWTPISKGLSNASAWWSGRECATSGCSAFIEASIKIWRDSEVLNWDTEFSKLSRDKTNNYWHLENPALFCRKFPKLDRCHAYKTNDDLTGSWIQNLCFSTKRVHLVRSF